MSLLSAMHRYLWCHYTLLFIIVSSGITLAAPMPPTNLMVDGGVTIPSNPDECRNMKSGWIFCSSFEEGNKEIWDDYDGNPDETNQLITDAGPFVLNDNHVMRLISETSGRGGADLVKVLPESYDQLYFRWYMKWEDGYDFNAQNHVGVGLHAGDRNLLGRSDFRPDGTNWFSSFLEATTDTHTLNAYTYYRGMYMDCGDPNGQCWGDYFPCEIDEGQNYCTKAEHRDIVPQESLQTDRWYCLEMKVNSGTPVSNEVNANGQLNFWIDGKQIGPWSNLWFRTTGDLKLNILWINLFFHGDHAPAGVLYDNVVVSTNKIGCR